MSREDSSGGDESPVEDNWDEENVVAEVKLDDVEAHLRGYYIVPTNSQQFHVEPPRKRAKTSVELRDQLNTVDFVEKFRASWKKEPLLRNDVELINDPFDLCIVQNFLHDPTFTENLLEEINEFETWRSFSTDLLKNAQSVEFNDLQHCKHLQMFYQFLKTDVKSWLERVTGGEYDEEISAICSMYRDTDYLLLHDDRQEKRAIAYVFYITGPRSWKQEYGGSLQLYDMKESKKVRDIYPADNQFVFFEVSNKSGHQVGEVTTKNDCRISINGWFHYKNPPEFQKPLLDIPPVVKQEYEMTSIDLDEWIQPTYLDQENMAFIQNMVEENSEASLINYFLQEKYNCILDCLRSDQMKWSPAKPISMYRYDVAIDDGCLPEIIRDFVGLFRSVNMFELLMAYTELELMSFRYELQRWDRGSYCLMSDANVNTEENVLEVITFFGCSEGKIIGGDVMYIAKADFAYQEALLSVKPTDNCLNLVYRDSPRLIKYVSNYSTAVPYYVLICSYYE